MSIRSNMSDVSVILNGQEVNIDDAINDTYRDIQGYLNTTQSQLRNLAQVEERSETFFYSHELCSNIDYNIKEILELFKDLKSIVKQVRLKPTTPEEKEWQTNFDIQFKIDNPKK